jgi:selenide,water dikinase
MDDLPIMDQALEMYRQGVNTGVNAFNQRLTAGSARFEKHWPLWHRQIVYDPQTSGGLLAALPAEQGADLIQALEQVHTPAAALIGHVLPLEDQTHLIFH